MFRSMSRSLVASVLSALALVATPALASTVIVTEIAPNPMPAPPVPGVWFASDVRPGGTASVSDLTGLGGNLETAQPLPTGAAKITTDATNAAKAEVAVPFAAGSLGGTAADIIPTLDLSYWWHKAANAGQNPNAAPSIKLTFFNPTCDQTPDPPGPAGPDCFATLVYEPYVNGFGNFPTQDLWQLSSITATSGSFWTTGGFGFPNGAGGCGVPVCPTLAQWLANSTPDFGQAELVAVSVGVGSFNPGQVGYFDDVRLSHDFGAGFDIQYDFQAAFDAAIDVRPHNQQNQVNTGAKQLVPIAILGSAGFDPVSEVDPESVLVRGVAQPIATKFDDDDVNGDGFADLTLYFRARTIPPPTPAECDDPDAQLELTGETYLSIPFVGSDDVEWQGPACN